MSTEQNENLENMEENPDIEKPQSYDKINVLSGWLFNFVTAIVSGVALIYWSNQNMDPETLEIVEELGQSFGVFEVIGIVGGVIGVVVSAGIMYAIVKFLTRALWDVELRQGALIQGINFSMGVSSLFGAVMLLLGLVEDVNESISIPNIIASIILIVVFYFVLRKYETAENAKLTTITRLILTVVSLLISIVSSSFMSIPGM